MRNVFLVVISAMLAHAASAAPNAFATTALKQVQVSNGSQVDLLFDGKVSAGQIKTEFFNDIIQFSLTDVSVYPAKISSVNGGDAHQDLRLSVRAEARALPAHRERESRGLQGQDLAR